jgi:2-keto-4-pentenoate hydratase
VGLTSKAIQEQVDFRERVFGFLLESGELPSGVKLTLDELVAPSFEVELLVVLGEGLKGPDVTAEQVRAVIASVAPSLELVEKRGDFAADPALSMADNVQQRAYVVGPLTTPVPSDARLDATTVEVYINGERMEQATGDAVLDGPAGSVAWLANRLADFGQRLEKGTKILTGSVTRQFPIAQGDVVEARFAPYGMVSAEFV